MQAPPCVRGRAGGARRSHLFAQNCLLTALVGGLALVASYSAYGAVRVPASQTAETGTPRVSIGARGITRMRGLEPQVLSAINNLRRAQGLGPLRLSQALTVAACQHSLSMAEHGFFEHSSLDGSPFWKRVEAAYPRHGNRWKVGENLAWASPGLSAHQALELWLASPSHRETLLSSAWREIGLGAVHAIAGGVYNGRAVTILSADFGVQH